MALTKVTGQVIKNTTDVTVGVLTVTNTLAVGGTVSIGGTLTYEDVTNVDAVGLITARNGIVVGSGITLSKDGDIFATGVTTSTTFVSTDSTESNSATTGAVTIAGGLGVVKNIYTSGAAYVQGSGGLTVTHDLSIADKIVHTGDTNTAIRFPDADTISFETGGSTRAKITSTGNFEMPNDNDYIKIGAGGDLQLVHTGSASYITNSTGFLEIQAPTITFENASGTERARIDSSGRLLLGTGAVSLPKGTGGGSFDLDGGSITMCVGGNINSTGRTNSTDKINRITSPHYTNAEEPVALVSSYNVSGNNTIFYGGGSSTTNAVTQHSFYTAADTTTTTGTERLKITSSGQVFIGNNVTSSYDMVLLRNTNGNVVSQIVNTNTGSSVQSILQLQVGTDRYVNFNCNYTGQYMQLQGVNITTAYNDFDTHIFRANNGTEKVRITSGGKLNIGDSANTGYSLKVKTTGSDTALARFEATTGAADGVELSFYHNTGSPADGDQTGYLQFSGNDSNGNGTIYNAIIGYTTDVTDGSEDGDLRFFCRDNATFSQKLNIAADGTFTGSSSNDISDQRLKDNIATVVDPITKIKALKGRTFTWKPEAKLPAGTKYGFIAQEVETVVSDLVDDKHGIRQFDKDGNLIPEDENGKINTDEGTTDSKSVNAIGVVPILVEALKETLVKIETLETRLNNAGIAT